MSVEFRPAPLSLVRPAATWTPEAPRPVLPVPATRWIDEAAARFAAVAAADDPDGRYHRFSSALHDVLAAIDASAIISGSPLAWRLQNWPRGYAGDFETIEMMCRGDSADLLKGLPRCIELWALNCPPVQQHRNKIRRQAALMMETLTEASPHAPARVLSIACGPSRDARLLAPIAHACHGELWLNDADADALEFSASRLDALPIRCHYVHGNILRSHKALAAEGPFDLVLAGGLFDYLTDRQAGYLVRRVHERLLKPGGRFFFTNILAGHGYRGCLEHVVSWSLIERTAEQVLALCAEAGVGSEQVEIGTDETGLALLVTVYRDGRD